MYINEKFSSKTVRGELLRELLNELLAERIVRNELLETNC